MGMNIDPPVFVFYKVISLIAGGSANEKTSHTDYPVPSFKEWVCRSNHILLPLQWLTDKTLPQEVMPDECRTQNMIDRE